MIVIFFGHFSRLGWNVIQIKIDINPATKKEIKGSLLELIFKKLYKYFQSRTVATDQIVLIIIIEKLSSNILKNKEKAK